MTLCRFLLVFFLGLGMRTMAHAEGLTVKITPLGLDRPSPFQAQLLVQVANESFLSNPLIEKITTSQLLVDGQPFPRLEKPFEGPVGLPPQGTWEGCLSLDDYLPADLVPGTHALQLNLGGALSKSIKVKILRPEPPATTTEARRDQVRALQDVLTPGLLRGCVENWLTEQDGGLQSESAVHYYVDPGVKVLIPYEQTPMGARIRGRVKIYTEERITD
jgi:hypothetical protein